MNPTFYYLCNTNWLKNFIFKVSSETEIQGLVNFEDLEFGFLHENIVIIPREKSIEITLQSFLDKDFEKANLYLIRLLQSSPNTPIKGIGLNTKSVISGSSSSKIKEKALPYFDLKNNDSLCQIKFTENQENHSINTIIDKVNNDYAVNFNFHYNQISELKQNSFVEHYNQIVEELK